MQNDEMKAEIFFDDICVCDKGDIAMNMPGKLAEVMKQRAFTVIIKLNLEPQ